MMSWPERITAVSDVPLLNFAREFPSVSCVTASGTDLPFAFVETTSKPAPVVGERTVASAVHGTNGDSQRVPWSQVKTIYKD